MLAGLAAAKWLEPRAGDRWPALAAALTIGIATVGWLASPEVRSILGERGIDAIGAAIIANLGGFVAGVAFLRGVPYARLPPDPRPIGTALAVGTPGIALAAIVGGMVGDPWRSAFLDQTTGEVVVFLVAGIASLTLSRLTLVGSGCRRRQRRLAPQPGLARARGPAPGRHRRDRLRDVGASPVR